jgi:hypothetical protein
MTDRKRDAATGEHVLRLWQADCQARAAVGEKRLYLGAAIRHVQRAKDRAEPRGREIRQDELRRVRKLHCYYVAAPDAARFQCRGGAPHARLELQPVDG